MSVFRKIPGNGPHGMCEACGDGQAELVQRATHGKFCYACALIVLDAIIAYNKMPLPRARLIRGKFVGIRRGRKLL